MRRSSRAACLAGVLALWAAPAVILPGGPAGAATNVVTVTTTSDGGAGSLREAFETANTDGSDTEIVLAAGALYRLTDCSGAGGDLDHHEDHALKITGSGATIEQMCSERVITNDSLGTLTIDAVLITGGNDDDFGGGIFVGLFDRVGTPGNVTITNSIVIGNASENFGGGLNCFCELVTIVNSTFANNSAAGGAGIGAGAVTVVNSTITGNHNVGEVGSDGGGISAGDTLTLVYATIVGNSGENGANLELQGDLVSFASVVTGPLGGGENCAFGDAIDTSSHGYNFSDDDSCGFTNTDEGDRQNAGSPVLGNLAANGGATLTRLPQSGSPLIDAIPIAHCQLDGANGIARDQRGVTRPQGSGCDIGSVEVEVAAPVPIPPNFTG